MKKVLSIILAVCLLLAVIPFGVFNLTASAATREEAVDWLKAQNGAWYDIDGAYGAQCSDFASAYMNWLVTGNPHGGTYGVYNANYYPTVASWDTSKWEVIPNYYDFVPQPGDIFVSVGADSNYGHIGVVISSNITTATIIDQNYVNWNLEYGSNAVIHDITWTGAYSPTYYIRFKNFSSVPLATPTISFNKSSYTLGDTITVSWQASPSGSNLSHYWITICDPSGNAFIDKNPGGYNTSFSFTPSSVGTYSVKVYATPIGSQSGEGSLTDTKSITVGSSHTHSYGSWTTVTSPTCTSTGTQKRTCSGCGNVQTQSISALGHSYSSSYTIDVNATCSVAGTKSRHCTRCGAKTDITSIPKGNHNLYNTIGNGGYIKSVCYNCSYSVYESSPLISYSINNGVVTIEDCDTSVSGDLNIPDKIDGYTVAAIADNAFNNCSYITKVTIPSCVTSIGDWAFRLCTELESITVDNGNTNYSSYNGVLFNKDKTILIQYPIGNKNTSYSIPQGVTDIYWDAFLYASTLKSVTMPNTLKHIDSLAFRDCTSLTSITIPDSVTSIDAYAFYGCTNLASITIPDSVTEIGFHVFENTAYYNANKNWYNGALYINNYLIKCDSDLTGSLLIKSGTRGIAGYAFEDCPYITGIIMPDSIKYFSNNTFTRCESIKSISFLGSRTQWKNISVGKYGNELLNTIEINYSIDNIESYLTYEIADGMATITDCDTDIKGIVVIPSTLGGYPVTTIGSWAFYNCKSLTSITIPASVTSIESSAFSGCTNLASITIPDSVTSIEFGAFSGCTSLTSITIPDSVTSIGYSTFENCTSLTSITIPDSVTSIGTWAFKNCTNLTSIIIPDSVASIGSSVFENCNNLTNLIVANGSKSLTYSMLINSLKYISIPDSVTDIPTYFLDEYKNLLDITVDQSNEKYYSINGVLCDKEIGKLIYYPVGKTENTYQIPDGVTIIGYSAFYNCTNLTSITIPDSVTSIESGAFSGCTNLVSITIPDSVTSINSSVFRGCTSLTSITIPDSVTSIGDCAFIDCTSLTSITIPDSVTSIGEDAFYNTGYYNNDSYWDDDVFYIGNYLIKCRTTKSGSYTIKKRTKLIGYKAFCGCTNLVSITIPDSVTSINSSVFRGCTSLTSITIPNSVTSIEYSVFSGCTSLTSIIIPDSVTSIGNYAFENCTSLTSITIPNSVTSIEYSVFSGCTSLTSVTLPDSITSIDLYAFYNCTSLTNITIPDSVTSIGGSAFENCTSLTSITLPDSITSIGSSAFYNTGYYNNDSNWDDVVLYIDNHLIACKKTKTGLYIIREGIISIATSAFRDCTSLTNIIIPNSVTSIGAYAFIDCTSLTSITIPDSVTSIGDYAFSYCTNLTSITIPDSVTSIGENAFYNTGYYNNDSNWDEDVLYIGNYLIKCRTTKSGSYTIKKGTKLIGHEAFYGCKNLTSITIPDGITSIGFDAFSFCTNLTSITIPDSVTIIGYSAFYNCTNLTSITIPDCITSIGFDAFYDCTSLESIIIPNSVTTIGERAFYNCTNLTDVYYCGNESDRANIKISGANTAIENATWHYNYCVHKYTETVIDPTCTEQGYTTHTCEKCDDSYTDSYIPATGHNYVDTVVPPTADQGYTKHTCSNCGDSYTDSYTEPVIVVIASGSCGTTANWELYNDGTLKITGSGATKNYGTQQSVPWFAYASQIKKIKIAETITKIGHYSFYCLTNLECVTTNNADLSFGYYVFSGKTTFYAKGAGALEEFVKNEGHTLIKPENPEIVLNPELVEATMNSITLKSLNGYEYSMDGIIWQDSNVFTGLFADTEYVFYQRIKDGVYKVSATSEEARFSTLGQIEKPVIEKIESNTVTLVSKNGYEYSIDGKTWQSNNVFTNLDFDKILTFYQRIAKDTENISEAAECLIPSAPVIQLVGATKIVVKAIDGYEYSLDGEYWQSSNVFTMLVPEFEYVVYQRYAGEDVYTVISAETAFITNGQDLNTNPSSVDLVLLRKELLLNDEHYNLCYDYNGDGEINVLDLVRLKKFLVGIDVPLGTNEKTQTVELLSESAYLKPKSIII